MNIDGVSCKTGRSNIDNEGEGTMMPQVMATCVSPAEARAAQQPTRGEFIPVAEILEVLTQDEDGFDSPSASSFVTDENEQFNRNIERCHQITGYELLARLKEHRKRKTARSAAIGGLIGMLILGPVGALSVGTATAVLTKRRLKKREKKLLSHLDGRLDEPLEIVSRNHCPQPIASVE